MKLLGKKVLVAGMGKSGIAVLSLLLDQGAVISLYDKKEEEKINEDVKGIARQKKLVCFWGKEPPEEEKFDLLILSPGIPLDEGFVKTARNSGAKIIGELELAFQQAKGNWIGITGTNGKTTTTTLVGKIFLSAHKETFVVGNIGTAAVSAITMSNDDSWLVTEISSFQLETIYSFKPIVSALLNITPDHLNRHKTMEEYSSVKARIFENQTSSEYFVVNKDCPISWNLSKYATAKVVPFSRSEKLEFGCFLSDGKIVIRNEREEEIFICEASDLKIPGTHNLENALAAAAISFFAGINPSIIGEALRTFEGVEHRIEFVDKINGVSYINDSKGTNTDAAGKALDAMKEKIILIAGGYDKNEDFTAFISSFNGRVKHMMLLGVTADKIAKTADKVGFKNYTILETLSDCVKAATEKAVSGDIVLLSPACASWGMYNNYEERGRDFKSCVRGLRGTV